MEFEEVLSPGEMQGALLGGKAGALLEQVGDVVGGKGALFEGIGQSTGRGRWAVDVAEGDDLAHVVVWVEASLFELSVVEFGLRGEGEKAHEDLVVTRLFSLLEQRLWMVGVFEVAMSIVTAGVAGDELVLMVKTEAVGIGLERQGLSGQVGRDGVAVGIEGDAELPGGAHLRDRGDVEGVQGERPQVGLFTVPKLDGRCAGFAVDADIGDGVEPVLGGGGEHAEVGDVEAVQEILFHVAHGVFDPSLFVTLADVTRHDAKAHVRSKVLVLGIEHGRLARQALEDGGLEIVDHDGLDPAAKGVKGVLVTGEEVLHGLGDGELDVH